MIKTLPLENEHIRRTVCLVEFANGVEHGNRILAFGCHLVALRANPEGLQINQTNRSHAGGCDFVRRERLSLQALNITS